MVLRDSFKRIRVVLITSGWYVSVDSGSDSSPLALQANTIGKGAKAVKEFLEATYKPEIVTTVDVRKSVPLLSSASSL